MREPWHRHLENVMEIDPDLFLWCFEIELVARAGKLVTHTFENPNLQGQEYFTWVVERELDSLGLDVRTKLSVHTRMALLRRFEPCVFAVAASIYHDLWWQAMPLVKACAVSKLYAKSNGWAFSIRELRDEVSEFCK